MGQWDDHGSPARSASGVGLVQPHHAGVWLCGVPGALSAACNELHPNTEVLCCSTGHTGHVDMVGWKERFRCKWHTWA